MFSPLINVLIKIFVKGFYRVHSGLLLFFFVTIITCGFFVEVLNQNHLPPTEVIKLNLLIVLTLISSPVVLILVFVGWLIFTIKSWDYVTAQLMVPSNLFLFYSCTSNDKITQFKSWFTVQFLISLPIIGYGLFSLLIGIIYGYYVAPGIILLFTLLLASISAFVYMKCVNNPINRNQKSIFSKIVKSWPKPFFSLFLYHAFDRLKMTLIVTKLFSFGIIAGGYYLLANVNDELRIASIIILGAVMAHAILIYQSYRFEIFYLSFSRNFPFSKSKIYFDWAMTYLLLTLPESIWLLTRFDIGIGVALVLFNLGTGMLIRSLLYFLGLDMRKYLYWVFYLFNFLFVAILLKLVWLLVPLNLVASFIIFNGNYFTQRSLVNLKS
ncbi:MAG: hypothetical protein ACKVOQ_01045 [Cyclobacteriaceae bacterium]